MHPSESACFFQSKFRYVKLVSVAKITLYPTTWKASLGKCTNLGSFSYRFSLFSNLAPLAHMKITRTGLLEVPARTDDQRSICAVGSKSGDSPAYKDMWENTYSILRISRHPRIADPNSHA